MSLPLWGVLAAALVAAVVVVLVAARVRTSTLAAEVDAAWDELTVARSERHAAIPGLVALVRPHAADQERLVDNLAAHHVAATRSHEPVAVGRAERRLETSLATVLSLADAHPRATVDRRYAETRGTLLNLGRRITAAQGRYDAAVTGYNAAATGFPGVLLRLDGRDHVGLRADAV